jgi:hypothetical protein
MERKNATKSVLATRSKSQKGRKKLEVSASKSRRTNESKKVKAKGIPTSPDSSSSGKTNEDYIEFLKTYDPRESYPYDSPSREEDGSQITVESQKKTPKSLKVESDSK